MPSFFTISTLTASFSRPAQRRKAIKTSRPWRACETRPVKPSQLRSAVEALLQARADVNTADKNGFAPLSVAASAPIATMLIERGADLNATSTFGQTALWRAVEDGDRAGVVQALLQAGAAVNKADDDGDPPLSFAASSIGDSLRKNAYDRQYRAEHPLTDEQKQQAAKRSSEYRRRKKVEKGLLEDEVEHEHGRADRATKRLSAGESVPTDALNNALSGLIALPPQHTVIPFTQ